MICALVGAILSIALLVAIGRAVVKRRKISMYSPVRSRSEQIDRSTASRSTPGDLEQSESTPISSEMHMKPETAPASRSPPYNPAYFAASTPSHGYGSTLSHGDAPPPYSEI